MRLRELIIFLLDLKNSTSVGDKMSSYGYSSGDGATMKLICFLAFTIVFNFASSAERTSLNDCSKIYAFDEFMNPLDCPEIH